MSPAEIAGQKLLQAILHGRSDNSTDEVARLAMAQAMSSQATLQAIINLIVHKNLITAAELDRFLTAQYEASYERLTKPGLVVAGGFNGAVK